MARRQNSHRKQHYVPQCYTKAWIDPASSGSDKIEPYVWTFDRGGADPRRRAPSNLFVETDIYTIKAPDGSRDLRLEHGFQELEDRFARVRARTFDGGAWPDTEGWAWVLAFVATAKARTASHRDHHRDQWKMIRERMEDFQKDYERASPEQRRAFRSITPPSSTGRGMTIEDVRQFEAAPIQNMIGPTIAATLPLLGQMSACVLQTDDAIGFITTDNPVTWFDPESYKYPPMFRGPGLGSRSVEVTLPISPTHCLLLTHRPEVEGLINVGRRVVDETNRRHIAHCAERFISRSSEVRSAWFEERDPPDDSWEKARERKIASGEWPDPNE